MTEPILYEQHMHTPLCRHAVGDPEEYAAMAKLRGLKGIVVTCHNPLPDGLAQSVRMYEEQWDEYLAIVARARRVWEGHVDVRLGLECDYWPGLEPFLEKQLASTQFHHVLGSVHPQMEAYRTQFWNGDMEDYREKYFENLARAAESKLFDTLSHPDLIKNEQPSSWGIKRMLSTICRALDRIAASGVAMELNTSGLLKSLPEMNPGPVMLREMQVRGIPVVIGADAHKPTRVADRFEEALDLLEAAGYTHTHFHIDRTRHAVPIDQARASLQPIPVGVTQSASEGARLAATVIAGKISRR